MRTKYSRRRRMPVLSYLLYLVIATLLLSGVTLSRYVASDTGRDGARVIRLGTLSIEESGNFEEEGKWLVTPGANMTKRATVHFEGSEAACYLFLKITAPDWRHSLDGGTHRFSYTPAGATDPLLAWDVANGESETQTWIYLCQEGTDSYIFYTVVAPNTTLSREIVANDGEIRVSPSLRASQLSAIPRHLSFTAVAVQYDGFGKDLPADRTDADHAAAAWNAVSGK